MTNNIFVPQTFNGERMVNVNSSSNTSRKQTPTTTTTTTSSLSMEASHARPRIAPNPAAAAVVVAEQHPNNKNNKKVVSPQQFTISPTPIVQITEEPENNNMVLQKYWSEANIAILIQLHRKYFGTEEMRGNTDNWTQLCREYNQITCDNRPKKSILNRWDKLMKKYNAERSCMAIQQQQHNNLNNQQQQQQQQQQMPMVSYWNHFQYMDSYLNHLPIPDDILYKNARYEDENDDYDDVVIINNKRSRSTVESSEEQQQQRKKMVESPLEAQRMLMEQTLSSQQLQIDLMKKNYDNVAQMNMKFIEICEKVTTQNNSNEKRYLNLLEKYMDNKLLKKTKNIPTTTEVEESDDIDF